MSTPAYLKLYYQLREDIIQGVYPFGLRLPPKRTLAQDQGLSLVTVEHAYALLADEGYVEARQRSGYYVCYQGEHFFAAPEQSFAEASEGLPEAAMPAASATYRFPFSVLARTMRRVLSLRGESILERSPDRGLGELRLALSEYLARSRGIRVKAEQIIIGSGAEFLYGLIVPLLGREKLYALEDPSYEKIRQVYEAGGARCQLLPMGTEGIKSKALASSRAGVLHVTPFHSFPSGVTAGASKRAEYLRWARERDAYLVEDDYDSEFTLSSKAQDTLFARSPEGRVIYLNSFTRTIAPSLRIGYMVLPLNLLTLFDRNLGYYSCSVPLFEQIVLAELLKNGDFERHINRVRRQLRKEGGKNG